MKTLLPSKKHSSHEGLYAVHSDFCKIFTEDMSGLHLLALLLTGDYPDAEQCFVAGFEDSIQSNRVFKQWAHSWSRRAIIKNAIRMVRPSPSQANSVADSRLPTADSTISASLTAVFQLQPFERFVLVMSVLEGYTSQDCATLLNCTRQDVIASRTSALKHLTEAGASLQTTDQPLSQLLHVGEPLPISGAA
ncbi:MAG TPA: hypothetical protein VI685_20495 [Candidatus Angelobacter sp.]